MSTFCLLDRVQTVMAEHAGRLALESVERSFTYAELDDASRAIASALTAAGVERGSRVAIVSTHAADYVPAMLGALHVGAAFVPITPDAPDARVAELLGEVSASVVVCDRDVETRLSGVMAGAGVSRTSPLIALDRGAVVSGSQAPPPVPVPPPLLPAQRVQWQGDDLAYVYFTSGSTGRPKGIAGRYKAIRHFIEWEQALLAVCVGVRVSHLTSPAFDASLRDIFLPLCSGGVICVPPDADTRLDGERLAAWIDASRIEVLHCVPSLLRLLLAADLRADRFEALRHVLLAGEPVMPSDVDRWMRTFGDRIALINLYGPSETTMTKLFYRVKGSDRQRRFIPIGAPMPDCTAAIVDTHGRACPPGMVGEIYLRTPYRALGYYGQPELTATVFVPNPFSGDAADIVYRTGDLGRWLEDGTIEFLGRRDQQVKVQGVRVELGEVEEACRRQPGVLDVAVVDRETPTGARVLCAYVVLDPAMTTATADAVAAGVATVLPAALRPAVVQAVPQLPRTVTGKVDRRALPAPAWTEASDEAPATPVEELLAGVWATVLGVPRVGRTQSFFALGGHSLLATQALARVRQVLGREVPLRWLFETPTVAGVAARLAAETAAALDEPPVTRRPDPSAPLPLSFAQQRLWFLHEWAESDSRAYHVAAAVRVEGPWDATAWHTAVATVQARHEALRTRIVRAADGTAQQMVEADVAPPVHEASLGDGVNAATLTSPGPARHEAPGARVTRAADDAARHAGHAEAASPARDASLGDGADAATLTSAGPARHEVQGARVVRAGDDAAQHAGEAEAASPVRDASLRDGVDAATLTSAGPARHEAPGARVTRAADDAAQHAGEAEAASPVRGTSLADGVGAATLAAAVAQAVAEPFVLETAPLWRVRVWQETPTQHVVLLVVHHILADGWALGVLVRELSVAYAAARRGVAPALGPAPWQLGDYVVWERAWLQGPVLQRTLAYWQALLQDAPTLALPLDRPRPLVRTGVAASVPVVFDAAATQALRAGSQRAGVTLFMLLLSGLAVLWGRAGAAAEAVIGTVVANRRRPEWEGLVGMLANTLALRVGATGSGHAVLAGVRARCLDADQHSAVPFERLVDTLGVARDVRQTPLFQVLLVLQNVPTAVVTLDADVQVRRVDTPVPGAKFDLTVSVSETATGLDGRWEYATDVWTAPTIRRWAAAWQQLLAELVAHPEQPVESLPWLSDAERTQIVETWNATMVDYGAFVSLHQLVQAQAARTPEAIAVTEGETSLTSLTYTELLAQATALAHVLQSRGVGPETRVGIYLARDPQLIVALFAILLAGGVYVPLDPSYPAARVHHMLHDSGASLVLTTTALAATAGENALPSARRLYLDALLPEGEAHAQMRGPSRPFVAPPTYPAQAAYVIYTSGSTGQPKGVVITHDNAVNFIRWSTTAFTRHELSSVMASTSVCFDLSIFEIFAPLAVGGCIVLTSPALDWPIADPPVALVNTVPSLFAQRHGESGLPAHVGTVNLAGEALPRALATRIYEQASVARLWNLYGPTEATTYATGGVVSREPDDEVSIGRPLANTRVYILDAGGAPVPIGATGELYIGGAGLARGYHGQPGLTASRFVPDPFGAPGSRLYRTGDSARYRADGEIAYLGRRDGQVKLRGQRIEIQEIEAVLARHPLVQEAAAAVQPGPAGSPVLCAYAVLREPVAPDTLRTFMASELPAGLVPAVIVPLDAMPRTASGKCDRRALPPPRWDAARVVEDEPPRAGIERALAEIWRDLLRTASASMGRHANFFELGGDSIISLQVVARARAAGWRITARQVFQHPTIAALATVAEPLTAERAAVYVDVPETGELAWGPMARWWWEQPGPAPDHFNQAMALRVTAGWATAMVIGRAVDALVARHAALRLRVRAAAAMPAATIVSHERARVWSEVDLRAVAPPMQRVLQARVARQLQMSLSLSAGPVMRVAWYVRSEPEPPRLLWVAHHLVIDGVSWRVLLDDLEFAGRAIAEGRAVAWPEQTASVRAWSAALGTYASSGAQASASYWTAQAASIAAPLPLDDVEAEDWAGAQRQEVVTLDREHTRQLLERASQAYGTRVEEVLLAALAETLAEWSRGDAVRVALEGHGREEEVVGLDVSRTVGWFTTWYPLVLEAPQPLRADTTLKAIKEQVRAVPDRGVSYGALRYLAGRDDVAAASEPGIIFNYLGQFDQSVGAERAWQWAGEDSGPWRSPRGPRRHRLELTAATADAHLHFHWSYGRGHHAETIARLAARYATRLRALIAHAIAPDVGGYTPSDFPLAAVTQEELDTWDGVGRPIEDAYPLAPVQDGLLVHSLAAPGDGVYVEQVQGTLTGALDLAALRDAWNAVAARHAVLRTEFVWADRAAPLQRVRRAVDVPVEMEDWRGLDAVTQDARWRDALAADRAAGFDLSRAPLLRVLVVRRADEVWTLRWTYHHAVLDGWSTARVLSEVMTAYRGDALDPAPPPYRAYVARATGQAQDAGEANGTLDATRVRPDADPAADVERPRRHAGAVADAAASQLDGLASSQAGAARTATSPPRTAASFWRDALAGVTAPTPLPFAAPGAEIAAARVRETADVVAEVDAAAIAQLSAAAVAGQVTLATVAQATWALVLARLTGHDDVVFGTTVAGRGAPIAGIERMVGVLINTLPVRVRVPSTLSAGAWVQAVQTVLVAQRPFEASRLRDVQGWSDVPRGLPLITSVVVFENYPVPADDGARAGVGQRAGAVQVGAVTVREQTNYALTLVIVPGVTWQVRLSYAPAIYDETTAQRLLSITMRALTRVLAASAQPLDAIDLLDAAERTQIVTTWNATATDYGAFVSLHDLVQTQAARTPDAIAVMLDAATLTYAELLTQATALACELQARGVGPETRVGVYLARDPQLVVALLAILLAGGAYVPLDPSYPAARVQHMLHDSGAPLVLTTRALAAQGGEDALPSARCLCLDAPIVDGEASGVMSPARTSAMHRDARRRSRFGDRRTRAAEAGAHAWAAGNDRVQHAALDAAQPSDLQAAVGADAAVASSSSLGAAERDGEAHIAPPSAGRPFVAPRTWPGQAAYVIYTSGSTGRPKGVVNTHEAIVNRLRWMQATYALTPADRVLQKTPISFDVSVWELFWPLITGARLVLARPDGHRDSAYLAQVMADAGITITHFVPSMLTAWLEEPALETQARTLRHIICSGEALTGAQQARVEARLHHVALSNLYGPTEAAIDVSAWICERGEAPMGRGVPIGRPIANLRWHVADAAGQLVPSGVPGELYLAGVGLARGYHAQPARTAERFVPDPFGPPGSRRYRTGDRVQQRADGVVEYLGRLDGQIKLRGQRIELGEIEAALAALPNIREVAVRVHRDQLVAYVATASATADSAKADAWRTTVATRLPSYMIPARFIVLDELPRTVNGKLDRRALPDPESQEAAVDPIDPSLFTPVERELAIIWMDVLRTPPMRRTANFFELGGDSIRALQVRSRAERQGLAISLEDIFTHQTLSALAAHARPIAAAAQHSSPSSYPFALIEEHDRRRMPADVEDAYPLAQLQAGMLFHADYSRDSAPYHDIFSYHLRAPFDEARLRESLALIASRHAVLRTSFELTAFTTPLQLVHARVDVPLAIDDLRADTAAAQDARIAAWIAEQKRHPFDWTRAPLLRVHLHRRTEDTLQFTVSFHHAILDGWSLATLLAELFQDYLSRVGLHDAPLAPPPVSQYRDFVRQELDAVASPAARDYWHTLADSSTALAMPRWVTGQDAGPRAFRMQTVDLPQATSDRLHDLVTQAGVPMKSVLLAAHLRVLSRLSGQLDVMTGCVTNGRLEEHDGDRALGVFLNTLPCRLALTGGRWIDLVRAAFDAERAMLPYRRYPLGELKRQLAGRDLFDTAFNFAHYHVYQGVAALKHLELLGGTIHDETNFTLLANFSLNPASGRAQLRLDYDAARIPEDGAARIAAYYQRALELMGRDPSARYETQTLLTPDEETQLQAWTAGPAIPQTQDDRGSDGDGRATLADLFIAQAARTPDAEAIIADDARLTYAALHDRARIVADLLRTHGVGPDTPVAICLTPSADMAVAVLGILLAGGCYVPLDPRAPRERLDYVLTDAGVQIILTEQALIGVLPTPSPSMPVVAMDAPSAFVAAAPVAPTPAPAPPRLSPDHLAYIIYTSGSTGQPKGIALSHRALVNLIAWHHTVHRRATRTLQFARLSFDASFHELFAAWTSGGAAVIVPEPLRADPPNLARLMQTHAIEKAVLPVVMLQQLADWWTQHEPAPATLREIITTGEQLRLTASMARLFESLTDCELHNHYGPSETHVVTATNLGAQPANWPAYPPIGRPISHTQIHIVDRHLAPVPPGTAGELLIGGVMLARGYVRRPALTAAKFIPDPFGAEPGARLYRTGDLARFAPDGQVEFLGRLDQQVKIRGFRVELGEIEAALHQHPDVDDAVVVTRDYGAGDVRLIAYVARGRDRVLSSDTLRAHVASRVPDYMVPGLFVCLDSLPVTANGKVDYRRLPEPDQARPDMADAYEPPATPAEEVVAEIWSRLLRVARVGVQDDLFALGGHSLLAMQIVSRVRETFQIDYPLRTLIERPTVRGIVDTLTMLWGDRATVDAIAATARQVESLSAEELQHALSEEDSDGDQAVLQRL